MNKSKLLKVVGAITLTVAAIGGIVYVAHKFKEYFLDIEADFIDEIEEDDDDLFDEDFYSED